ncbi:MAG: hypothetical protein A2Y16_05345 [Tenericutes bacterium GWF2_57_13]|nr:MAG: hypothetical protein A2Y16_05345 [Tenericutes bacterium GWF2_57_13]
MSIQVIYERWDGSQWVQYLFKPADHDHDADYYTKAIADGRFEPKANGRCVYYIEGTGSVDGTWLGSKADITSLYSGLTIMYRIPRAGAATVTLNLNGLGAKIIYRFGTSKLTTHFTTNGLVFLTYTTINDGGCWMCDSDYDSTSDYELRWQNNVTAGAAIYDYKIIMEGANGKFYPLTLETGTGTTKTVSTAEFRMGGVILWYASTTDIAADANFGAYALYESVYMSTLHYTANAASGFTAYRPIYLKGTINASGNFMLDNTTATSWLTQTLPTSDDGFVYILLGLMNSTTVDFRLVVSHPAFEYKDGAVRPYTPPTGLKQLASITTNGGYIASTTLTSSKFKKFRIRVKVTYNTSYSAYTFYDFHPDYAPYTGGASYVIYKIIVPLYHSSLVSSTNYEKPVVISQQTAGQIRADWNTTTTYGDVTEIVFYGEE